MLFIFGSLVETERLKKPHCVNVQSDWFRAFEYCKLMQDCFSLGHTTKSGRPKKVCITKVKVFKSYKLLMFVSGQPTSKPAFAWSQEENDSNQLTHHACK